MPFPFWNRGNALASSMLTAAGAVIVSLLVLAALLAPVVASHDPQNVDPVENRTPPFWLEGGTTSHPLGTDHVGRDIWSRLIYGARNSLMVGLGALAVGGVIGIALGIVFAYYRPPWDGVYNLEASFPVSLLLQAAWLFICLWVAVSFVASLGPGIGNLIVAVGLATWPRYIKVIRHRVLNLMVVASNGRTDKIRISEYAAALRRFLPQIAAVLPWLLTSQMAFLIAVESLVTFLGVGIPPPTSSLGGMVSDSRADGLSNAWWMSGIPFAFAVLLIAGFWMLGTGLSYRTVSDREDRTNSLGLP